MERMSWIGSVRKTQRSFLCLLSSAVVLCALVTQGKNDKSRENSAAVASPSVLEIDYSEVIARGSPYVFGGAQPRGLSESQWDTLKKQGFRFMRMQADLTELVPCDSPKAFLANRQGCAKPKNWDWQEGIYGDDFVSEASARGMRVCLVIKNARWNRWQGAPDDEETMPRDLEVWGAIVRKIVNHYEGAVDYIELFNEVDRDPQFLVEGSPYDRKTGYQKVARRALEAVAQSEHPETPVGGPVASWVGKEQVKWLLDDPKIRSGLGFLSFHTFDAEHYPSATVKTYRSLMAQYGVDLPIIRSSYVPEYPESDIPIPGTIEPVPVAGHLIGTLKDGLEAAGLWEIQNKGGEDDPRYWFDDTGTVPTANLWVLMSNTLKLGKGPSRIVALEGLPKTSALAAINVAGEPIAVCVGREGAYKADFRLKNLPIKGAVEVNVYRGDHQGDGKSVLEKVTAGVGQGECSFSYRIPERSVVGFRIEGKAQ